MAYQARLSDYVRGGVVVDASLTEGTPVTFTQSGVRNELPNITAATAGMVNNVGILMVGPDQFPRPTDARMYTVGRLSQIDPSTGYHDPINSNITTYNVGKSVLWNPTVASGELALVMRGGSYAVLSGQFTDSAAIRVPGAMIKVGTGPKWEVTTSQTDAVGVVEEYNTVNGVLIFTLWH
jgi:hypothetical protein